MTTLDDQALALVPAALLLLLARAFARRYGDWLAPSALFALYWGVTLLAALVLAPGFVFWPPASWYVLACAALFQVGVVVGAGSPWPPGGVPVGGRLHVQSGRLSRLVVVLTSTCGVASAVVMAVSVHGVIGADVSLGGVLEVGAEYASRRYSLGEGLPVLANLLNVPFYAGQAYAGAWVAGGRFRDGGKWLLMPLAVGLLQAFLSNARTPFVWMTTFLVGGWLAGAVYAGRTLERVSVGRALAVVAALAGLGCLYVAVQWNRDRLHQDLEMVLYKAQVAFLSTPSAFSQWLELNGADAGPRWGVATLGGLMNLLGLSQREQGLGWIGKYQEVGGVVFSANVYTAFRQIIEDVTLFGSFLLWTALGGVMGVAYRLTARGRPGWMAVLAIGYALLGGSYLASWATYNTCLFGAVVFWALCSLVPPLRRRVVPATVPQAAPVRAGLGGRGIAGRLRPGRVR